MTDERKPIFVSGGNPIPQVREHRPLDEETPEAQPETTTQVVEEPIPSETPKPEETTNVSTETQSETTHSPVEPDDVTTSEKPEKQYSKLERDIYKERERRRQIQAENAQLRTRLERLETSMHSFNSQNEESMKIKTFQEKLGIDEESAKKLSEALKVVMPKPEEDPLEKKAKEFQKVSMKMAAKYEDWKDLQPEMQKRLEADFALNPEEALSNGPLYYYNEVKRFPDPEALKEQGRKEMATKLTQKNLAMTESSKNSLGKPVVQPAWTAERIREIARDPSQWNKHRDQILAAFSRGEVQ